MSVLLDYTKGFNLKDVKTFNSFSFKSAQQFKETGIKKVVDGIAYFDVIYENHLAAFEFAKATNNRKKRFHTKLIEMEMGGVVDKTIRRVPVVPPILLLICRSPPIAFTPAVLARIRMPWLTLVKPV
jgi:hypothetical protein